MTEDEWLTADEVSAHLAARGRKCARDTWHAYVSRAQAPAAGRHVGRTPQWSVAQVEEWLAARPRAARTAPAGTDGR